MADTENVIVKAIQDVPLKRPGKDSVNLASEANDRILPVWCYFYQVKRDLLSLEG